MALHSSTPDGWVVFAIGALRVATFVTSLVDVEESVVVAVLAGERG
jgi:hypothetical protein